MKKSILLSVQTQEELVDVFMTAMNNAIDDGFDCYEVLIIMAQQLGASMAEKGVHIDLDASLRSQLPSFVLGYKPTDVLSH